MTQDQGFQSGVHVIVNIHESLIASDFFNNAVFCYRKDYKL